MVHTSLRPDSAHVSAAWAIVFYDCFPATQFRECISVRGEVERKHLARFTGSKQGNHVFVYYVTARNQNIVGQRHGMSVRFLTSLTNNKHSPRHTVLL